MSTLNSLPVLKPKKVESTEQPKSDKELERLRKIRERIIRNRASANASRQKKKEYMEMLEKKNKELTQHKEKIDKENQKLKDENENLKVQVQYLTQALNKMNSLYNNSQNNSIEQTQIPNVLLQNNNVCPIPLIDNNFSFGINSPESLSSISLPSPLFNDNQDVISSTNTNFISNNNNINTNLNTPVSIINTLSPQSSVGEPAALTNENSLQRTLFCQRIMYQILQTVILTKSLTNYLIMTIISIIQTSAYRPLNNNNSYKNLYLKKNYIQPVPTSVQKSQLQILYCPDYHKNKYFNYWSNKFYYWKDKIS